MLKSFIIFLTAVSLWLGSAAIVFAQVDIGLGQGGLGNQIAGQAGYNPGSVTDTTLSASIGRVVRVLLSMVGTVFLALTIYAGILWMTASGNEEQVTKAKQIVSASAIGLLIVLSAYGVTALVLAGVGFATQPQAAINAQNAAQKQGFWTQYGGYLKDSALRMMYLK